jgi:hypothetical protein
MHVSVFFVIFVKNEKFWSWSQLFKKYFFHGDNIFVNSSVYFLLSILIPRLIVLKMLTYNLWIINCVFQLALINAVSGSLICQPNFKDPQDNTRKALSGMAEKVVFYDPEFVLKVRNVQCTMYRANLIGLVEICFCPGSRMIQYICIHACTHIINL